MATCGRGVIEQTTGERMRLLYTRCKCWSCSSCAPHVLRKLRQKIADGQPNMHLVLTCDQSLGFDPLDNARRMMAAWKLFVKRIKRYLGIKHLPFFLVIEKHKSGQPHFHILLRCKYIPQKWLSENWNALVAGPVVWVRRIRNPQGCVDYITKYLTKAPERFGTMQRYSCSRDWPLVKPLKSDNEWKGVKSELVHGIDMLFAVELLHLEGWIITHVGKDGLEATAPPGRHLRSLSEIVRARQLQEDVDAWLKDFLAAA